MEERQSYYTSYDDLLIRDIRMLIDILTALVSSYRLLVGAADEFNGITLAHESDLKGAIDRADDMGDIIDDIDKRLKYLIKQLIKRMDCNDDYDIDKNIFIGKLDETSKEKYYKSSE